MLIPSSSAVVAARPTRRPSARAASRSRRSSGRYPERYAATFAAGASRPPSARRAASATASAPRRDRDEGEGRDVLPDQAGQQVSGLRGRCPAQSGPGLAARVGQRRLPQRERDRPARRPVLGDLLGVQPGQQPGTGSRRADRRRSQHEDRPARAVGRGVVRHHPAQPPQHVSHVRAEDAAVLVAFVDDHVAQPAEEAGPAGVAGQQGPVQHVRSGQQVPGVAAGPGPLGRRRVPVEGGGLDPRQGQGADRGELVRGQGLGRCDVEHGLAGHHGGERRQQVAERFARRRPGTDDHIPAGLRMARGVSLV